MDAGDAAQHLAREITGEARDEPGRFRAFLAALGAVLSLPADAHVVGEPVEILSLDYSGHPRQGLTARCRRDGREYVVSLTDLTLPPASPAARLVDAYHLWCGLELASQAPLPRPPKAVPEDVPGDRPVDLVVLALKQSAARCRLLGSEILEAIGARKAGDVEYAREILENLLARDLRSIAAREMLGSIEFRAVPREALRYYESGMRVGDLSFPLDFHGVLPWSMPGNRPFLGCLRGYGLCLWRQKQFDEARRVLERLLVLDPDDHQGVRAASGAVERRQAWEESDRELAND